MTLYARVIGAIKRASLFERVFQEAARSLAPSQSQIEKAKAKLRRDREAHNVGPTGPTFPLDPTADPAGSAEKHGVRSPWVVLSRVKF